MELLGTWRLELIRERQAAGRGSEEDRRGKAQMDTFPGDTQSLRSSAGFKPSKFFTLNLKENIYKSAAKLM